MVQKLDIEKPLFLGPEPVRENTVMDHVRRAVSALDEGQGVPYGKLEEYLLKNYAPAKSQNYSGSFIKSYVRDGVNKYSQLSYEDGGHEYSAKASPEKTKEVKPKRVTKVREEELALLAVIRDRGEVADASQLDVTQITVEDLVTELGKKTKTIEDRVKKLVEAGDLRVEAVPGNEGDDVVNYVYLTAAGFAAVNAAAPEGADSAPGAAEGEPLPEAAVVVDGDDAKVDHEHEIETQDDVD